MKRILLFAFVVLFIFTLSSCKMDDRQYQSRAKVDGQAYFNAVILEVCEGYIIVECMDETSGYVHEGERIEVSKEVVLSKGIPRLVAGDEVRVVFSGLEETEPLKLNTIFAIYPLDELGRAVVSFEPETIPQIAVDADINMFNYKIAEGMFIAVEADADISKCHPHFSLTVEDSKIKGVITVNGYVYNITDSSLISVSAGKDNAYIAHAECIYKADGVMQYDARIYVQMDDELEAFYIRLSDSACFVGPADDVIEAKALYEKLGLYSVEENN